MKNYQQIFAIFESIYGEQKSSAHRSDLIAVLEGFGLQEPDQAKNELTEKDSILITYGDAIQSKHQPPLATLRQFLTQSVNDAIRTVHLLPFFPYSSDDGFSVIDFYRVDPELGSWREVDALAEAYDLMFDAVINHISVQSAWFQGFLAGHPDFKAYFISVEDEKDIREVFRPRALPLLTTFNTQKGMKKVWTTFSADQVDLNYHHPSVLIEIVKILLNFVAHGARFIRLDAIAYIWKEPGTSCIHLEKAHRIVQFIRAVFDCVAPYVKIITETNVPHEDNIAYFGDGSNEAQLVYNFSLPPLVLHAFHTQNTKTLTDWAKTLETPSQETHFFNFLASHDGIGVTPARGLISDEDIRRLCERVEALGGYVSYKDNPDGSRSPYELNINYLDALGNPRAIAEPAALIVNRFLASQSIMLALKGVPGIYYHSLLGSRSWKAGVKRTGRNRTINREKLDLQALQDELSDPNTIRNQVFNGYLEMLQVRGFSAKGAFNPQGKQSVFDMDARLVCLSRQSPDERSIVVCFTNVTQAAVKVYGPHRSPDLPDEAQWRVILARNSRLSLAEDVLTLELGAFGVLWLLAEGDQTQTRLSISSSNFDFKT